MVVNTEKGHIIIIATPSELEEALGLEFGELSLASGAPRSNKAMSEVLAQVWGVNVEPELKEVN